MESGGHLVGLAQVVERNVRRRVGYVIVEFNGRKVRVPLECGKSCKYVNGSLQFNGMRERRIPREGDLIVLHMRPRNALYEAVEWGYMPDDSRS